MALIDEIEDFKVGDDVDVPERLTKLRDAVKETSNTVLSDNAATADKTTDDAAQTALDRLQVASDRAAVEQALADAVAVVTGGTASLAPAPGKLPIAGASGTIAGDWVGPLSALSVGLGMTNVVAAALGEAADNPDWIYATAQLGYYSEPVPAGKYLGQFATPALAAAAPDAEVGDWYQGTSNDGLEWFELTNVGSGTEASTEIYRAGSPHPPSTENLLAVSNGGRCVLLDCTYGAPTMWMVFSLPGRNVGTNWVQHQRGITRGFDTTTPITLLKIVGSRLYIFGESMYVGFYAGYIVDFATGKSLVVGGATYDGTFPVLGGIEERNSNVADQRTERLGIQSADAVGVGLASTAVYALDVTLRQDAPRDTVGNRHHTVAYGTAEGAAVIDELGQRVDIDAVLANANYVRHVEFTPDTRLWLTFSVFGTQSAVYDHVIDVPATSTAIVHDTAAGALNGEYYSDDTTPLLLEEPDDGTNLERDARQLVGHDLYIGGTSGLNIIARNPVDQAEGVISYKTSRYTTPLLKRPLLAIASDSDSGAISDAEILLDSEFTLDNGSWTFTSDPNASGSISGGLLFVERSGGGTANVRCSEQSIAVVEGRAYALPIEITAVSNALIALVYDGLEIVANQNFSTVGVHTLSFVARRTGTYSIAFRPTPSFSTASLDYARLRNSIPDRSGRNNHLDLVGSVTRAGVENSGLYAITGFSDSNYLLSEVIPELTGVGDLWCSAWVRGGATNSPVVYLIPDGVAMPYVDTFVFGLGIVNGGGVGNLRISRGTLTKIVTFHPNYLAFDWTHMVLASVGNDLNLYINGQLFDTLDITTAAALAGNYRVLIGGGTSGFTDTAWSHDTALTALGLGSLSDAEVSRMYQAERQMLESGALLSNSNTVDEVTYDATTQLAWVSNGTSLDGVYNGAVVKTLPGSDSATALAAGGGKAVRGTASVATFHAEERARDPQPAPPQAAYWIDAGVGDGLKTDFPLPGQGLSIRLLRVEVDGVGNHEGASRDYTLVHNGFDWVISFAVAPAATAEVDVEVMPL